MLVLFCLFVFFVLMTFLLHFMKMLQQKLTGPNKVHFAWLCSFCTQHNLSFESCSHENRILHQKTLVTNVKHFDQLLLSATHLQWLLIAYYICTFYFRCDNSCGYIFQTYQYPSRVPYWFACSLCNTTGPTKSGLF